MEFPTRKPYNEYRKQKRINEFHQEKARLGFERKSRIGQHILKVFRDVLEKAEFHCAIELPSNRFMQSMRMTVWDSEDRVFSLTVLPAIDYSRRPRCLVKVFRKIADHFEEGPPFFSWDSRKEPRPYKAALLLRKKLEMNPYHEVMGS